MNEIKSVFIIEYVTILLPIKLSIPVGTYLIPMK